MEKYFAQEDSKGLVDYLMKFNGEWSNLTTPYQNGIGAVWARNINYYFNNVLAGDSQSSLNFDGQLGEMVKMLVPQARSLMTQYLSLTTKQKLHFVPQALSTDAATIADTRVGQALAKRIVMEQNLDQKAYRMAEGAGLMGQFYIKSCWRMDRGKLKGIHPVKKNVMYTGGLHQSVHSPLDVAFDHVKEDFYDQEWVQVREMYNRWDLIAAYPDLEEEIRKLPKAFTERDTAFYWQMNASQDTVFIYHWFHRASPALPLGRYCVYGSPTAVLFDDDNPYKDDTGAIIPVAEMKPEPITGTGFGYPFFSNVLPLQEMLDHNFSVLATVNNALAVPSILNPSGNDLNVKHIQGLNFLNYTPQNAQGGGKPERLDLNSTNVETYKFNETIMSHMQQIMNLNSAIRGEPQAGIKSGTAIATLSANAIEFAQNFSKAYVGALEKAIYHGIICYRNFVTEEEIVSIAGPNDSTIAKGFIGHDLTNIKRMEMEISNPLMSTAAGKLEVANNLMQMGAESGEFTIDQYLSVLDGAPLRSLYAPKADSKQYLEEENDNLRRLDGEPVVVAPTDDPGEHIHSHSALLNNFEVRKNPQLVKKIMDHITDHYEKAKFLDPILFSMIKTGQTPLAQLQQAQAAMPPPGAPGSPPGGPIPPPGMPPEGGNIAQPATPPASIQNPNLGGMAPPPPGV